MKSNIKIWILYTGLLLAMMTSASAQVVTLDSVLDIIDRKNPMLQEYDNKVRALNE